MSFPSLPRANRAVCVNVELGMLLIGPYSYRFLQNVSILTKADRCSLFLVQGERGSESRCLVSKLFDVCSQSTLKEMEKKEEIRIPWGTGIVGYVAQSGEPVNIPDAYKVTPFFCAF